MNLQNEGADYRGRRRCRRPSTLSLLARTVPHPPQGARALAWSVHKLRLLRSGSWGGDTSLPRYRRASTAYRTAAFRGRRTGTAPRTRHRSVGTSSIPSRGLPHRVSDRRKTTLAKSVGELPLDPHQRTGTDGSDPLNVCASSRRPETRIVRRRVLFVCANRLCCSLNSAALQLDWRLSCTDCRS